MPVRGSAPMPGVGKTPAGGNWGKGGLNIDLDLSLAKQYNKPLSPTMNQLQTQGIPAAHPIQGDLGFYSIECFFLCLI